MKDNDLLYQVALTRVPHIGDVHAKMLAEIYGSAENIFHAPKRNWKDRRHRSCQSPRAIRHFNSFAECEREITFDKYGIKACSLRRRNIQDGCCIAMMALALLYYKETPTSMPTGSYR